MRILAIRGCDLASLAGPFELDLKDGRLGESRIFLITGPVGAGKSTLLDALSVALFHRTPRLAATRQAKFDEVTADEARNLLRRGATHGYAEVDFQVDDGRRFRARWEVRRAQRHPDGVILKPSCSLVALETGKTRKKGLKETSSEIRRLLGLDFDQFRRSVLLAQGDFALFLNANSNERAALLERMTQTELYRRLSKAAFQRAKKEVSKADSLQQELHAVERVPSEETADLQRKLEDTDKQRDELEELLRTLHRQKDWFAHERQLRLGIGHAETELAEILEREPEFDELKKELLLTETALSLAPWFSAVDELQGQAEVLTAGLETQKEAAEQAREKWEEAEQAVEQAGQALQAAELSRKANEPAIEEALRLDEQLRFANQAVQDADDRCRQASEKRTAAEASLLSARERTSQLQQRIEALEEFQNSSGDRAGLFTEKGYWLEQISQYEKTRQDEATKRQYLDSLSAVIEDLRKKESGVAGELATESSEIERLEAASVALEAEIGALGPDRLVRQQEELQKRQEAAAALERSNVELRALLAEVQRNQSEREEAVQDSATARNLAAETGSRLPALEAAAAEAERAWKTSLASRQADIDQLRSELRRGTPCPVCGALDHPWASIQEASLDNLVDTSSKRHAALAQELAVLRGRRAQQEAHLAQLQAVIRRTDQRLSSLKVGRDKLRATIDEGARQLGLSDSDSASQALAAAKSRLESIARELRLAQDKEAVLRSTVEQLRSRRRVYEKHRALHGKVQTDLSVAMARETSVTALLAGLAQAREKLGIKLSIAFACMPDLTSQSADPGAEELGHNLPLLDEDCKTFRRVFETQAEDWKERMKLLDETRQQAAGAEAEVEFREREIAQAAAACTETQADLAARQRQVIELADKRGQLFEGRSVADVRLTLDQQVELARQSRRSAELNLEAANVEVMRLETTIGSNADHAQTNTERLAARQAALDRKLKKRDLTEQNARQLALRGEEWCRQTSDAISEFENQRARASERLKERTRQLSTYERTRPERDCEAVERLFQEIAGQRKELDFLYDDIKGRLADAQSAEDRINALTEKLVAQEEEGRVWIELGELIGSADGKAFRNFAQRYTLQLLIEHANEHLGDLKPRYRLEKCPDGSGDPLGIMVVDQDMGDERRPVTTLSEGESFLVSLALALGLASLQARNVRLESLFIDEGLGTLDSASLHTVLSALEAVQLQDRQIGVISHVDGLAEYFPAEVRVVPVGMGASRVEIAG